MAATAGIGLQAAQTALITFSMATPAHALTPDSIVTQPAEVVILLATTLTYAHAISLLNASIPRLATRILSVATSPVTVRWPRLAGVREVRIFSTRRS